MTVIQFPEPPSDGPFECECGSQWFDLTLDAPVPDGKPNGSILLNAYGSPTGYAGLPTCRDCGKIYGPESFRVVYTSGGA